MAANAPNRFAADRNLLFGILALQMDFISRDALVAAMHAWVLDKTKPLSQILTQQEVLRPEDRDLLEVLIKRHLQMHGNDAQRSLATLGSIASLGEDLRQVADPEVQSSLAQVSQAPQDDPYVTRPSAVGQPSVPGLRFRILREHAKGGLGAVFVANDEELHREVALKEIQGKYAHHAESRARFLLEAEVTGALEHPGVVPVYGLGCYPDGRPFYAMRFIRGDSFHEAIRRFYAADEARRDAGERSLAFRELLGRFVDACNALAYAHSRGILHRDVKPRNIMLGKYGETLVVDWGLAKVIGRLEGLARSEEGTLRPSSGSGTAPTQMGHVMGTPAYMSPEQAEGRLDELGPACDIYSLGATLYELLTGREPIQGSHVGELLAKVKRADWLPPRKVRKDVPAALDAICRKALALRPEQRYASAMELAADIEHWLADEPVATYREPWSGSLRRWVRRHRGLAAGTAGLLIAAMAALAVGFVVVSQEKNRTEQARLYARQAFDLTTSRVVDNWLSRYKGNLEPVQKEYLETVLAHYREFTRASGGSQEDRGLLAKAHRRVGDISSMLGQLQAAEEAYRGAVEQYKQLVADFPQATAYRQELANCHDSLGNLLKDTGRYQQAEEAYRVALTLYQQLVAEFPAVPNYRHDQAATYNNLGILLKDTRRPKEAEAAYREALALNRQLANQFPDEPDYRPDLAGSHNNLANLLQATGRLGEAEGAYGEAIALYRQLVDQLPAAKYYQGLAKCQSNLGLLLQSTGRLQDAEAAFREALTVYRKLANEFAAVRGYRHDQATTYNNLGILLKDTGRREEAEVAYREALSILKRLTTEAPGVPGYRQELARSYNNIGTLMAVTDRPQEAESAYRQAVTVQKQLVAEFPNVSDYDNDLANTTVNLAELLRDRKEFPRARELLEEAVPYHQAALKANPQNPSYRLLFQINRAVLASTFAGSGDHAGARRTADQLAALGWDPAGDAYAAARAQAQCVAVLEHDTTLAEGERQKLIRSYAEQALLLLREAIAKGYKDVAQLNTDTYLEPLRARPEFVKLLKELEAKVGGK